MRIRPEDYAGYRGFFAYFVGHFMPEMSPDVNPITILEEMEAKSPAKARQGLAMAISDSLEMSQDLSAAEVKAADADLAKAGLPTLSELRVRFWKKIGSAVERGKIRNEVEYYAVRNAAEIAEPGPETDRLWALLDDFERRHGE